MKTSTLPVATRAALLLTSLGMAFSSQAAVTPITWSGISGADATVWADGTNWSGGAAPADDIVTASAVFNLADFTGKQPNAGTRSVAGLQIGNGSATGLLTISGIQLTLGASGIDMQANAGSSIIAAPVVLGANQTWANASTNTLTLTGTTSGGATLAKSGAGKIILSGSSTRSGATSISGGTLQLGSSVANAALGTGAYDIGAGSTLRLEYATSDTAGTSLGAFTWSGITGAGTLNVAANGVFDYIPTALALPAGFTGTLRIDGGRVQTAVATDGGLGGTSQIIVKNGGQLGMWESGTFPQSFTIDGTGYGEPNWDAALRMANSGKTTLISGTITLAGNTAIGAQTNGTATIANPIGQNTTSNLMVGGGSMSGTVIFQGVNTYTGTTTVRSGVLSLAASAPTVQGTFIMSGPDTTYARMQKPNQFAPDIVANFTSATTAWNRFEMFGKDQILAGITTGTLTTQGGGIIQNSEANGAAGANATLTLNGSGSYVFNGHVRDYGNPAAGTNKLSLVKNGSGTQTLVGGVVSYSGPTALNSGTLELVSTGAFKSTVTAATGTTLKLGNNGNVGTTNAFNVELSPNTVITHDGQSAGHFWVIGGSVTTTGTTTINQFSAAAAATDKSLFIDGGLKGSGTVTINATNAGNGVVFRNNNSTFAGNLIVNGIADTDVNEGSGIGVGGCTTALQNTDIQLNGTMELLGQGVGWAGTASGAFQMGALSGNGAIVGNHNLAGGNTTVTLGKTNTSAVFSGTIANGVNNTVNLVKAGSATQTLTGINSYTGNTTVNEGVLSISGGQSLSDLGTLGFADVAGTKVSFADDETVGGLAGGGTTGGHVDLQGHTLTLAGAATTSFSGLLSGTGSALVKTGGGTQTLAGTNSYTGPTSVEAGRLDLGSPVLGNVTVSDDAALGGEASAPSITLGASTGAKLFTLPATSGALSATGALTVNGTTLVDLAGPVGSPSFKILQFGSKGNAFTNANFELADPTPYRPGYSFAVNANDVSLTMAKKTLEWTGAEDSFWERGFGANFRDTVSLTPEIFFQADEVIFGNLPAGDSTIEIIDDVIPSSVTFDSTKNYTIIGDAIAGPGSLTKNNTGIATLTGTNTYTGPTTVNGGSLVFQSPGNVDWTLPTGSKTIGNGATMKVDFTPQSPTQFRHTHLGATVINAGGVLDLYSTTYNINSWHLIQSWTGGVTGNGNIRVSGGGAVGLWTATANPLSAFQGVIDVQDGQFAINVDNGVTVGGPLDVSLATAGKLDMRTGHFTIDALDGVAGSQVLKSHNTAVTLTVGNNNGSGNFAGSISNANGTIGLTKVGTGTQTLSGANTHTGVTTVNAGTLVLSGGAAIADTGAVVMADAAGAQLQLNASETIGSLAGGGVSGGNVNVQGNTLTVGNASNTSFAGAISGTGGLTKVGAGTLTLSGANSYSGNTAVNAGVLSLSTASLADSSTVTILPGAVLNLNGGNDTVASLVIGTETMLPDVYSSSHPTYGSYFTGTGSLVVGSGNAYSSWASSKGLSGADALADADPDKDGISNAIEFVIDGQPNPANPGSNSNSLLPTLSQTTTHLVFTYRRSDAANAMPGITIAAQYGSSLTGWTTAQHNVNNVTIVTTDNGFGAGVDKVEVSIPKSLATGFKLFARLKVTL